MNIGSPYFYPYQMGPAPVPPIYEAPPLQAVKTEPGSSNLEKMMKGKRKIKSEPIEENGEMLKPDLKKVKQEKITDHMPVKKKRDRFHGMSEEEVLQRTLPDHLKPNLDIVIIGFNPGLTAAYVGHHYAGPGNHFWKCLHLSELIPEPMTAYDDSKLLNHGIGFTNIVERTTRGSGDLSKKEIRDGGKHLLEKLKFYSPKIAVFNGKGIYEIFSGSKHFAFGKQPTKLEGTETTIFVMPSSSARCSQLPRAIDKVPFYVALRRLRDFLVGKIKTLDDSEVCFPDLELKVKTEKVDKSEKAEKTPSGKRLKTPKTEPSSSCPPQGSSRVKPEPTYDTDDYGQMPVGHGLNLGAGHGLELGPGPENGSGFMGAPTGTGVLPTSACAPSSTSNPPMSTTTPSFQALPLFDIISPPPPNQPVPVGMSQYTNYPQASYDYIPFPT